MRAPRPEAKSILWLYVMIVAAILVAFAPWPALAGGAAVPHFLTEESFAAYLALKANAADPSTTGQLTHTGNASVTGSLEANAGADVAMRAYNGASSFLQLRLGFSDSAHWAIGRDNLSSGDLIFQLGTGHTSHAEHMRINTSGKVLIATSTDNGDFKLQVAGNTYLNGNLQVEGTGYFAQEAWTEATYENSWVTATDADFATASYMIDSMGFVHLTGAVEAGTIGQVAFTLPAGYRPAKFKRFAVESNGAFGVVTITDAGAVTPAVGNNAFVMLDGIVFDTRK